MIVNLNGDILTIHEAPYEDDAFEYDYEYPNDITIFGRGYAIYGDKEWKAQGKIQKSVRKGLH